jgi:hypothetical protein
MTNVAERGRPTRNGTKQIFNSHRHGRIDNETDGDHGRSLARIIGEGFAMVARATFAVIAGAGILFAQPVKSAEAALACVLQSAGPGHEKRVFGILFDQHEQRAQIGDNPSLPATISDTQISFSVNLSGSILLYSIDRSSGFGTITIRDKVMYSGMCKVADPANRSP